MKTRKNSKLLCLMISLLMVMTIIPSAVFADTASSDNPISTGTEGFGIVDLQVNGQAADVVKGDGENTYRINEDFSFGSTIKFTFTVGGSQKYCKYDVNLVAPDGTVVGSACVAGDNYTTIEDEAGYIKQKQNGSNAILYLEIAKPESADVQWGTYTLVLKKGSISRRIELLSDVNFKIDIYNQISDCDVSMAGDSFIYTGSAIEPEITVTTTDGAELVKDTDYTVGYENNTDCGEAKVKISGIGTYAGTVEKTFRIYKKLSDTKITLPSDVLIYNGKEKEPMVTVRDKNGNKLKMNIDFEVEYINNIKCGVATAKITGINDYTGTVSKTFQIRPAKAVISKIKRGSKKFTVTVKSQKATGVTGYQIAYRLSTNKTYKTVKTTNISRTFKNLKKGKKYYVKVRAYKKVSSKKYIYGSYSSVKAIRVK